MSTFDLGNIAIFIILSGYFLFSVIKKTIILFKSNNFDEVLEGVKEFFLFMGAMLFIIGLYSLLSCVIGMIIKITLYIVT